MIGLSARPGSVTSIGMRVAAKAAANGLSVGGSGNREDPSRRSASVKSISFKENVFCLFSDHVEKFAPVLAFVKLY